MAGARQPKLTTDPRHPDTTADKSGDLVEELTPEEVTPDVLAQLDPAHYGFTNLETEKAIENAKAGPGTTDPEPAVAVASDKNSTFADRRAARLGTSTKVVGNASEDVATK